ncbi:MAG: metallophosphoesterase [Candidatus Woesearchaeota archaeon]|nr:MAG: metallophosphoesterase [Candidatus Woesearchaeota archaeon]
MDKTLVFQFLKEGYLVSPDLDNQISKEELTNFFIKSNKKDSFKNKVAVVNKDVINSISSHQKIPDINWSEFEASKALKEKGKDLEIYVTFSNILNYGTDQKETEKMSTIMEEVNIPTPNLIERTEERRDYPVIVLKSFSDEGKKRDVKDFVSYFRVRYITLKKILQNRQELHDAVSINRIINKKDKEQVSIIGIVSSKQKTKNGNIVVELEDLTDTIKVIFHQNNQESLESANNLVLDEVIGVVGVIKGNILFGKSILFPDIPLNKELKKAPDEVYAAFISDIQLGSNKFVLDSFKKFIEWLNGKSDNENQRAIALKIKYLFLVGDLVDGVGVYPGHEKNLAIKDIRQQYNSLAQLLSTIRKDIKMIICPGNHDAGRLALPQLPLDKKFAEAMCSLSNTYLVSNPAWVNIHSSKDFPGFDVLMFDGYGYHYYLTEVESLRMAGGHNNPTAVMKFLLQKRHLTPTHNFTRFVPYEDEDPLIINRVPDIFASGEMHKVAVDSYKNVTLLISGCWQSKTDFQEKIGIEPDVAKFPIVNLKTREVKILNFE